MYDKKIARPGFLKKNCNTNRKSRGIFLYFNFSHALSICSLVWSLPLLFCIFFRNFFSDFITFLFFRFSFLYVFRLARLLAFINFFFHNDEFLSVVLCGIIMISQKYLRVNREMKKTTAGLQKNGCFIPRRTCYFIHLVI